MLKNIKSSYFIKMTFEFIVDRQKIKVIKYNKALQSMLNINIIYYKYFTGKYLKFESNGITKEYSGFNDCLLYEGEYLNGKRNGKGKEYNYYGNLIYEGEYLNGKRNGKGKEYNDEGEIIFEGEYLNNKKTVRYKYGANSSRIYKIKYDGDKYFYNGKLKFEGEYLNGKNGKGKDMIWYR